MFNNHEITIHSLTTYVDLLSHDEHGYLIIIKLQLGAKLNQLKGKNQFSKNVIEK